MCFFLEMATQSNLKNADNLFTNNYLFLAPNIQKNKRKVVRETKRKKQNKPREKSESMTQSPLTLSTLTFVHII